MAKSLLNDRDVIPLIRLSVPAGPEFDSSDLKRKKNFVLFFMTEVCEEFLFKLEGSAAALRSQDAEIAVVLSMSAEVVRDLCAKHRLTSSILPDPGRTVMNRFVQAADQEKFAALFITDKFGGLFFQYVVSDAAQLPPFDDIVKSLEFIESQCPECGGGL